MNYPDVITLPAPEIAAEFSIFSKSFVSISAIEKHTTFQIFQKSIRWLLI
jgi:hypothetical protein